MTDVQLLESRRNSKHARVAAARKALVRRFGKSRVTIHAGSRTEYGYPDDTTHFLYIGLRLKKADRRNRWDNAKIRVQVIKLLERAKVSLYHTSYCEGLEDQYAISLSIERWEPKEKRVTGSPSISVA